MYGTHYDYIYLLEINILTDINPVTLLKDTVGFLTKRNNCLF